MTPATILGSAIGTAAVAMGRGAAAMAGEGLSFAAELLKAAGGAELPAERPASAGGAADLQQRLGALAERLRRHLAAAGIALSRPVEFISDGLGGIAVAGEHPQRAQIEAALDSDLRLETDFSRLAAEQGETEPLCVVVER